MIGPVSVLLVFTGSLFILVAAIGLIRMPDILMRMHAATKAGTLGVGMILLGSLLHFNVLNVTIETILTILFIFITAPVASHLLARAAYFGGIKLAKITIMDELKSYYQEERIINDR